MVDQDEFARRVKDTFSVFRHNFLPRIKITSKDLLEPSPMTLFRSQEYFLDRLEEGLTSGVHDFTCLKARQLGITTVMLPLDIFWLFVNPGLQGALIADTGDNVQILRGTITDMLDSLPKAWKVPVKTHNRTALVLENGSRLQYMSAGHGRNSGLGRSRALNFVDATEISSFGDQMGIDALRASLSGEHPNRLYVWESTAKGQNVFYDMACDAMEDDEKMFFFIGWWMKDTYRIDAEDKPDIFEKWWGGNPVLNEYEQETGQYVLDHYGYSITAEQWAWYRREGYNKSEESLKREFPSTELEAWITTGIPYFSGKRVNEDLAFVGKYTSYNGYKVTVGNTFDTLRVLLTPNKADVDLRVWEEPKKGARYVFGMDVAYGLSETNDRTVITVWRCFADKLVQVAEYATSMPETFQAAWVLAWLAGCYQDAIINLEISGPGTDVMRELKTLKKQLENKMVKDIPRGLNTDRSLDAARWFLYHRPDSMAANYIWNWKTNFDNKATMLSGLRNDYNTELVMVRSMPLLKEMVTLQQDGDSIQASGRNKDDRVIAAGLAHYAWNEWVRPAMMGERRTFKTEMASQAQRESSDKVIDHIVPRYFAARKAERDAAAWARALSGDL